jgi:uncharacterized protein YndB with AHSA1/START domain
MNELRASPTHRDDTQWEDGRCQPYDSLRHLSQNFSVDSPPRITIVKYMLNLQDRVDWWERRLDKLRALLEVPEEFSMTERSIAHGSFTVKRTYPVPAARVFAAFADPEIKGKWYGDPNKESVADTFDFKVGGVERRTGSIDADNRYAVELRYHDIAPNRRIIYAYEVEINGTRHSVSVAVVEMRSSGDGTELSITEHGAFLDGHENPIGREGGANFILERLGILLGGSNPTAS